MIKIDKVIIKEQKRKKKLKNDLFIIASESMLDFNFDYKGDKEANEKE